MASRNARSRAKARAKAKAKKGSTGRRQNGESVLSYDRTPYRILESHSESETTTSDPQSIGKDPSYWGRRAEIMPPFKDEHILMIMPGSQTTLAQLGLPESYTPAKLRVPTRMFPAEKQGEWEPLKIREKRVSKATVKEGTDGGKDGDTVMGEASVDYEADYWEEIVEEQEEIIYEEDPSSDEGAVYPIREGRIVDWPCFYALLTHIYNTLSPPFHTPILIVAQPAWTPQDHEILTQFIFEKFKTPAFCLFDAAMATIFAYGQENATVIDVGLEKCDITAITEFFAERTTRVIGLPDCGGANMTQQLFTLLGSKGFTKEMCEQLKTISICEILPVGVDVPAEVEVENPASAASTGATGSGEGHRGSIAAQGGMPRGPGVGTEAGDADEGRTFKDGEDDEGVLDVATIVASGKTSEFLAKKEREKAEKAAKKKDAADAAAAFKEKALPNSKRVKATFQYHERRPLEDLSVKTLDGEAAQNGSDLNGTNKINSTQHEGSMAETTSAARKEERKEEKRRNREGTSFTRRTIEVGPERLQAARDGILERIAEAVYRCILSHPDQSKRSDLWNSLVICGNGSKVKGFKEALLSVLNAKYVIPPSSATIFTSELPSNFTTPVATGANTPQPQYPAQSHHGQGVNPLLLAATTASNHLAPPGQSQHLHPQPQLQYQQMQMQQHSRHAQTPTSINLLKAPDYFPEWKEHGWEEAPFLGAQAGARTFFIDDQGKNGTFMSRTNYNELGPQGISKFIL